MATRSGDGAVRVTAVTDGGDLLRFTLRDGGSLEVEPAYSLSPLRGPGGADLQGKPRSDAEAMAADGSDLIVAFERDHRIERLSSSGAVRRLRGPAELASLRLNGGVEALAVLPQGERRVLAVGAEDGRLWLCQLPDAHPCQRLLVAAPSPRHRLTGLDHLPGTGDLMATYRVWSPLGGMRATVARIRPAAPSARRLTVLAELRRPLVHGNVEGVAVLPRPGGGWRLFLVTDDGFPAGSPTLLLAFDLAADTTACVASDR